MIRVHRPTHGPPVLNRLGVPRTTADCTAYNANPLGYQNRTVRFQWRRYHCRKEVKTRLAEVHQEKCCYCEQRFPSRANLHVEHYRPKAGFRQLRSAKDSWPGYYWLAYTWDNLLLACHDCNSVHKGTFFPLANPTRRARWHGADLTKEKPLLVDPARQNPRRHIRFVADAPVGRTKKGLETIEGVGLRRAGLREERLSRLKLVKTHLAILDLPPSPEADVLKPDSRDFLSAAVLPGAPFSSMVRDYLDSL